MSAATPPKFELNFGAKYRVKREVWEQFYRQQHPGCKDVPDFIPQKIRFAPAHPPFDHAIELMFPVWWWREEDVEECVDEDICPACDGRGLAWGDTCVRCGGKGILGEEDA